MVGVLGVELAEVAALVLQPHIRELDPHLALRELHQLEPLILQCWWADG